MIINFSVENFGPIKGKQELSFEAEKSTDLEKSYVVDIAGLRLLKLAIIYGANASGKTTILKSLDFLREIVLEPENKKTDELDFKPFLFDEKTPRENSNISLEFIQNGIKYHYEVEFFKRAIVSEKLDFYHPNKANLFIRKTDLSNQYSEIKFGGKVKLDKDSKKAIEVNTLWNNTVLGGFLKTNIDFHELKEASDWFQQHLQPLVYSKTKLSSYIAKSINASDISKNEVLNILKQADFHVSDILIREEEGEIPDGLIEFLRDKVNTPKEHLDELKSSGKIKSIELKLEHTINNIAYTIPFEEESQGTQRYFGLAGLLSFLIKDSIVLPIDELESSLHPDLFRHFIISFLTNSTNSQIIATSHNREILGDKDIFRDDAIWIAEKLDDSSTNLYSLADFDSSVIRDTTNRLNAYKSGKLGGIPNLGDFYIKSN